MYDTIVISYDLILCYSIEMESQICKTIDIFGSEIYRFVVVLAYFASCANFNIVRLHQDAVLICWYLLIDGIRFLRFGMILIMKLQTPFT